MVNLLLVAVLGGAPTVAEVLQNVKGAYGKLSSYSDTGTATSTMAGFSSKITFKTHFQRPDRLRFEFETAMPPATYVIWPEGKKFASWWTLTKTKQVQSAQMAIAAATGVSGGAAAAIPAALLNVAWGGLPTALTDPKLAGTEAVDAEPCIVVTGRQAGGQATTVWIDSSSWLIRKTRTEVTMSEAQMKALMDMAKQSMKGKNAGAESPAAKATNIVYTIQYLPVSNPLIPASAFVFTPPK